MDITTRLSLSYYKTIATINEDHKIYLAQHTETGKIYVKKILNIYSLDVYKFLKDNPIDGIPKIIDFFEEDHTLILIEEYITGLTFKEVIETGDLSKERVISITCSLCSILERLHSRKPALIHRDLKPSNIIIMPYDKVIILDFNAAKYHSMDSSKKTDTVLLGTHGYAAPEQYGFGESSPQTDIYSLGVIIREAAHSMKENNHDFDSIIEKCTQMDPNKRYQSVDALKNALIRISDVRIDDDKPVSSIATFLPPGFRTMTVWKMVVAIPLYFTIILGCFTLKMKDTFGAELIYSRISLFIIILIDIFVGFNYRDVQKHFPLCKSSNKIKHAIGVALLLVIITFIALLVFAIIKSVIFPTAYHD